MFGPGLHLPSQALAAYACQGQPLSIDAPTPSSSHLADARPGRQRLLTRQRLLPLAVDGVGGLLEGHAVGLRVEEVDVGGLDGEPARVDNVHPPLDGGEADGVDKGVEGAAGAAHHEHCGHALAALQVGEDLRDVQVGQGHHEVVHGVVDKDEGHDGAAGGVVAVVAGVDGRGGRPADVDDRHAHVRGQPLDAPANKVLHEAPRDARHQVPAHEAQVDPVLGEARGDADGAEDLGQVVRDEAVAGPLGEEADSDGDENAANVDRRGEELPPRPRSGRLLILDRLADLMVLCKYEGRVLVALGVVVYEDGAGLFLAIAGDEETGRLGDEPGAYPSVPWPGCLLGWGLRTR